MNNEWFVSDGEDVKKFRANDEASARKRVESFVTDANALYLYRLIDVYRVDPPPKFEWVGR